MSNVTNWNDSNYDDDEFLNEVLGLNDPRPVINPPPVIQVDPPMSIASGLVKIGLEGEKHIFRHAKEVQKGSRGGYLKGKRHVLIRSLQDQFNQFCVMWCAKKLLLFFIENIQNSDIK